MAAIRAAIGIVRIQAQTMRPATPLDSGESFGRLDSTIAGDGVSGGDGMPVKVAKNNVAAPAVSAQVNRPAAA
jgi:hypothetical protein